MRAKYKFFISFLFISAFLLFGLFDGNNLTNALGNQTIIYRSATEYDYPPFSIVTNGEADGFSVELLKAVAQEMGLEIEFKVDQWDTIKKELEVGKLDVLPLVGYSEERDVYFDFTVPYIVMRGNIFVRNDYTEIKTEEDLFGKEIIVMRGDNAQEYAEKMGFTDNLILVDTYAEAFELLSSGSHDAVLAQSLVGLKLINDLNIRNVEAVTRLSDDGIDRIKVTLDGFEQKFSFAVIEGDKELLAKLNEGLAIVSENGKYEELYNKWFPFLIEKEIDYTQVAFFFFFTLLIIILAAGVFSFYMIRKEVKRKTEEIISTQNDLKASEKMYRFITENGNDVITIYNITKNIHTYISPSVQKMSGFTTEEVRTMKFEDSIAPELYEFTIDTLNKNMNDFLNNPQSTNNYRYETRQSCKNGQYVWVDVSSHYKYNDENELETVNNLRNIDERKIAEEKLRESEEKYRLIAENVSDVISVYNITKNKFTYISPSIMSLRGFTVEEAMNERLEDGRLPEEKARLMNDLAENINEFKNNPSKSKLFVKQEQTICKNGERIWVELSIRFHLNAEGDILSTALIRNIQERKLAEEKMIHLSYHDQLTDLYNRRFYEEELLRLDTERNLPIALIMADVNGLKLTNDAFGHKAGDELIKNIAQIFKKVCRSDEIISRIGGDEFVILLPKCNDTQARHLIERLNAAISKDKEMNALLSVSIGYAVKESVLTEINEVFKEAEDDMYRHKLAENLSMRSKNIDLIMNSLFEKSKRERLHSDRVAEICEKIASNMNINQESIQQIRIAAVLHDIGKIGISDSILNKKGQLDASEWEEMKKHSEIGYRILSTVSEFSEIAEYVLSHQERWDGCGYPHNLKGEDIPVQARIIAIADAFDAMTVKRSYRDAMSETEAIAEIKKYAGIQFDPVIARIFVEKVMGFSW